MRQHNISLVKSNSEKNAKLSVFPTYLMQYMKAKLMIYNQIPAQ